MGGNPKQWVDDYNEQKGTKLTGPIPTMEGCASLAQSGPKWDAKVVQYISRIGSHSGPHSSLLDEMYCKWREEIVLRICDLISAMVR